MPDWIDIKDYRPDDFEDVLVIFKDDSMCVGYFEGLTFTHCDHIGTSIGITHWMKLPEPPDRGLARK